MALAARSGGSCFDTRLNTRQTDNNQLKSINRMSDQGKAPVSPVVRMEVIDEARAGQRVDNFLLRIAQGVPKSRIYRMLRGGEVRVNGRRAKPDYRLQAGDQLRVPPMRTARRDDRMVPVGRSLPVVYEDETLIVLDKPAGLAVHGGSGVSFGVIEQLRVQRPEARMLELVHRLDRETSGLLMVAKRRSALVALHDMMRAGVVEKRYLALVDGVFHNTLQHVRLPLLRYLTPGGERRVRVSDEGKPAHSIVRRQQSWEASTLVEVTLKTGRTHQIRVHLAHLGHPLLGDDKYGNDARNAAVAADGLKRMFLHAAQLCFRHPLSGQSLALNAALPQDLQRYLDHLNGAQ